MTTYTSARGSKWVGNCQAIFVTIVTLAVMVNLVTMVTLVIIVIMVTMLTLITMVTWGIPSNPDNSNVSGTVRRGLGTDRVVTQCAGIFLDLFVPRTKYFF
jgi:hypothetical protein